MPGLPLEAAHLDGVPVVLRDRVVVVRRGGVDSPEAGHIPGPLRVLVAVAAADLDADHELGVVLDALDKTHTAAVDFVDEERGTLDGILAWGRDAGRAYHVLHISSHGHRGLLQLEDADGNPVQVEAGDLAAALSRMRVVPRVVVLSSCHSAGEPDTAERVGFVDALLAAGVGCVIAMSHPVTDRYATALAGELYAFLEGAYHPDPVWGVAEARREVERKRLDAHGTPEEDRWGWPGEHVTPVCFVGQQGVGERGLWPLFDRGEAAEALPRPPRMAGIAGFPQREIGYFVGRRGLRRSLRSAVLAEAGALVRGQGGIGKSSLVASLADRLLRSDPPWTVAVVVGQLDVQGVARALRVDATPPVEHEGFAPHAHEDAKEAAIRQLLTERRLLLVLDNLESLQTGEGHALTEEAGPVAGEPGGGG